MDYFVTSFIEIARCVSNNRLLCDAGTRISELFEQDFDELDFELAICCFEATHRIRFKEALWQTEPHECDDMSIETFIETYVETSEQHDPLYVTHRFLMFKETLLHAMLEQQTHCAGCSECADEPEKT
jgi:hypothetical protein